MIVADASPPIAFAAIGRLDVPRRLFGGLVVPSAVAAEIRPSIPTRPDWIGVVPAPQPIDSRLVDAGFGPGETEVLALALAGSARLVILDERNVRREAERLGIATIGAVGLVVLAKEVGIVEAARPLLVALRDGGLYLSDRIIRHALEQAGEA